jgi:hypothetical protein
VALNVEVRIPRHALVAEGSALSHPAFVYCKSSEIISFSFELRSKVRARVLGMLQDLAISFVFSKYTKFPVIQEFTVAMTWSS